MLSSITYPQAQHGNEEVKVTAEWPENTLLSQAAATHLQNRSQDYSSTQKVAVFINTCFLAWEGFTYMTRGKKKKKKSNLLKLICSEFFPLRYIFSSETCICFTHFAVSPLAFSSAFLENSKISLFYLHLNYFSTNTAKENDKQRTKHCQTVSVSSHVSTQTLEKLAWK